VFDTANPQPSGLRFSLTVLPGNKFSLTTEGESASIYSYSRQSEIEDLPENLSINIKNNYNFGQEIKGEYYDFTVLLNSNYNPKAHLNKRFVFIFNKTADLVRNFSGFTIEPINRESSIVEISMKNPNAEKAADFLNMLTSVYLRRSLEKKNQIATNTINFIDAQLLGRVVFGQHDAMPLVWVAADGYRDLHQRRLPPAGYGGKEVVQVGVENHPGQDSHPLSQNRTFVLLL
jgi:hypothetical protein